MSNNAKSIFVFGQRNAFYTQNKTLEVQYTHTHTQPQYIYIYFKTKCSSLHCFYQNVA